MNAFNLLRQPSKPTVGACGTALAADAMALAAEWSVGSDLAMISAERVARENALRIALDAAHRLAVQNKEADLAKMLGAWIKGNGITMRCNLTDADLDDLVWAADDLEEAATNAARMFRENAE
jgi:hypothetical protein